MRREDEENVRALRRERVFRDPGKAFELPPNQFTKLFRLTRPLVINLCERLDARLSGVRTSALTVDSKVSIFSIKMQFFYIEDLPEMGELVQIR